MNYLPVFTAEENEVVKQLLATQVASMMGRKLEEGDWSSVYCKAKQIPDSGWSNLHIDVNHGGLGLELKSLRIAGGRHKPIKSVCGTTLMHPSATRSIRIDDTSKNATDVMIDVFTQYSELIAERTSRVREASPGKTPDMRTGWLIWEDSLTEFLYFEEKMVSPNPELYMAEWNITPPKGSRKASKSLWIYDRRTNKKKYSVTTSAGIKIQPYFDVPTPTDPNLYYYRVQSEFLDNSMVRLWISSQTARALHNKLGSLDSNIVSDAVFSAIQRAAEFEREPDEYDSGLAVPVEIRKYAYDALRSRWDGVSDEHHAQQLLHALS